MPLREEKKGRLLVVAGVDEAGRGPLAGPVAAACVVLPAEYSLTGVKDSKKLSKSKREELFPQIKDCALAYSVQFASAELIDQINIRQATIDAMRRAAIEVQASLNETHQAFFLIDGNMKVGTGYPEESIIKGDSRLPCIAAASILAKVARDTIMEELDARYPQYGFALHMGYPTKLHRERIQQHGPCPEHRRTFKGVREFIDSSLRAVG